MRVGNEGRKPPMRLPEAGNGAAQHQAAVDGYAVENRAPDRPGEIILNQVFGPQKIVMSAGLPVRPFGFDGPGCGFPTRGAFRPGGGGRDAVKLAELAQFGPEHAVILRKTARIVSLHIDDLAVLNAHAASPD